MLYNEEIPTHKCYLVEKFTRASGSLSHSIVAGVGFCSREDHSHNAQPSGHSHPKAAEQTHRATLLTLEKLQYHRYFAHSPTTNHYTITRKHNSCISIYAFISIYKFTRSCASHREQACVSSACICTIISIYIYYICI